MTLSPVALSRWTSKTRKEFKELKFPFRFTAVDLGSNSIKVRISEIYSHGTHETLWENKYPVRLGHETFQTGKLSKEIIKDSVKALEKIKAISKDHKVETLVAVATSAVREAANRQQLLSQAERKTDIDIEIIPGSEEARLIALGVLGEISPAHQDYLILDIGGGSTEVIFSNDYNIIETQSLGLGAVRLTELFVKSDPIGNNQFELLHDQIVSQIKTHLTISAVPNDVICYGCAGTIAALVEMSSGEKSPSGKKIISQSKVHSLVKQLRKLSLSQRMKKFGLDERRAEIILAGAVVLSEIMRALSISHLELSGHGVRDGLLQDFLERHGMKGDLAFDHDRAFVKSLFSLVDRYGANRQHAIQVCNLALHLFDSLRSLHGYGPTEKNILKGASLLHDIGQFISYSKHHKHAYYLIIHSDIPGITERGKTSDCYCRQIPPPGTPVYEAGRIYHSEFGRKVIGSPVSGYLENCGCPRQGTSIVGLYGGLPT
jgi:exopolyphosphatase / guanosine-5'-triphosphate,3'-diphosphate pyrophosphatase